ncbi:trimethylamine--corrinoid protein Co-methyltransferase [Desulfosalsimonas propionicica]|uniref:Trimethylamine--corrinoid protein Co-methyltransferase n=1 Tax=Desulfosalsimonas propionicica TaxID=332175 RepID=A0A7W0C7H9_9BACT|nr:trimethylamine methyltransferase family protein [Desulfosalsimonas propionicica]MBA2880557.1 trimethylamine--corrinoid protein Co-methyltransferase [Desulfosalsimonas propionicica]
MGTRTNLTENQYIRFSFLSDGQKRLIFNQVLKILQHTGARVKHEQACRILAENGCRVTQDRVYMPPHIVKKALDSVPPVSTIFNWQGHAALRVEHGHTYFGPGPTCPNFIDPLTFERRRYTCNDAAMVARVCEALSGIGFVMSLGLVSDAPRGMEGLFEFSEMIQNSTKPPIAWCMSKEHCRDIHQIAMAMAGGPETFRQKPNYLFYNEPISPLLSDFSAIDKVMYCARNNIPQIFAPASTGGGTVPATHAAHISMTLAESIIGVVISQIVNPGACIIIGGTQSILDMREAVFAYGAPELSSLEAGLTEMGEYLGLPVFSAGGCSDSKAMDAQAAIEASLSLHSAMLSGPSLVHDVGFMESGMCGSLFQLVLADEIIAKSQYIAKGVLVDEKTLAREEIAAAGPGGDYRNVKQTAEKLAAYGFVRPFASSDKPEAAFSCPVSKSMSEHIVHRTQQLVRQTRSPADTIPDSVRVQIQQILDTARARTGGLSETGR